MIELQSDDRKIGAKSPMPLQHIENTHLHEKISIWSMAQRDALGAIESTTKAKTIFLIAWRWQRGLQDVQVVDLVNLLNPPYLKSLPMHKKLQAWLKNPTAKNYIYHFYGQLVYILRWEERQIFNDDLTNIVRNIWLEENGTKEVLQQGKRGEPSNLGILIQTQRIFLHL